jgi:ATP-binding protein involved in chromosome partitioning
MTDLTPERIREKLRSVRHPGRAGDVVSLGMIGGINIKGSNVGFAIEVDPAEAGALEELRLACERAVRSLPGVTSCTAVLTAERAPGATRPGAPGPGADAGATARAPAGGPAGIGAIIAVASGKGGVGKSTTAVNIAMAMRALGQRVGLLDADIYGPSVPRMTGTAGQPTTADGRKLQPLNAYGVQIMSMGFLVGEDTPMIWRGPMVQSAIQQMLNDVEWGELDLLVVDLPPGTGDAQLTMAQRVPLKGAVIVSTPQDIALLDARKAINMFRKVNVPILGIIENMSYFCCPHCGQRTDIFAHGGARACAEQFGVDFLGEIPLDVAIRTRSDDGRPIVVTEPGGPQARTYTQIATAIRDGLALGAEAARPLPTIRWV